MGKIVTERESGAGAAVLDIVLVVLVSGAGYAAEMHARSAGWLDLGEDSKGVIAVLAGVVAALILIFARGQSLRDIGFGRPKRLWTLPFWIVGILAAYIAAQIFVPIALAPFFDLPAPDFSRYDNVYQNVPAALTMALLLPITASIPEEIIYRGFLMNRLTQIFGAGFIGAMLTVLAQSVIFGAVHFEWGFGGMILTSIMGAVWGAGFLLCGRNLWVVILAHSTGHLMLVAQLYAIKASEMSAG